MGSNQVSKEVEQRQRDTTPIIELPGEKAIFKSRTLSSTLGLVLFSLYVVVFILTAVVLQKYGVDRQVSLLIFALILLHAFVIALITGILSSIEYSLKRHIIVVEDVDKNVYTIALLIDKNVDK